MPAETTGLSESAPAALDAMSFADAATEVGVRVRAALNAVIEQIPGPGPIRTGSELASAIGIDINLAWKLLTICKTSNSAAALLRMPGDGALRILLRAAERRGVASTALDDVRAAFAAYNELIDKHAGTRAALETLLSHLNEGPRRIDIATRRAAYRANSAILGVQAAVQIATYIFWPETDDDGHSSAVAILRGFGAFRRLRPDVTWIIARGRRTDHQGRLYGQHFPQPLDPDTARQHDGVPLVKFFSSTDLPPVRRSMTPDGFAVDHILSGPVGLQGSQSLFLAEKMRPGLARGDDPENPALRLVTSVRTPCELLVFDALFHKDLPRLGTPMVFTASELGGDSLAYCNPEDRVLLHLGAEVENHGLSLRTAHISELPRYPEMLDSVCAKLGVRSDDLNLLRVKIAFPPVACGVMIERDMRPA